MLIHYIFHAFKIVTIYLNTSQTSNLLQMSGGGGQDLPRCLEDLAGKDYVFQIRITPCRFIPNQCTFTVSAISDDIFFGGLIQVFKNFFS